MDVVVVISDNSYQQYARTLIKTIQVFNYLNVVHVQIKDDLTEQDSFVIDSESKFTDIRIPQLGKTAEEKRVYSAVCRFYVTKNLLIRNPNIDTLTYIDADSIVRGQLKPLIAQFPQGNWDIGVHVRHHDHPYLTSVLLFSQNSKPLLAELTLEISRSELVWGQDQEVLKKVLSRNQSYRVLNLNPPLVGWKFHKSLIIWNAKGPSGRKIDAFIFESWALPHLHRLPKNFNQGPQIVIFAFSWLLDKAKFRLHFYSTCSLILVLTKNSISLFKQKKI